MERSTWQVAGMLLAFAVLVACRPNAEPARSLASEAGESPQPASHELAPRPSGGGAYAAQLPEPSPDWRPAPGESMSQVLDAHLLRASKVDTDAANQFVEGEDFDAVLAALSREAGARERDMARDHRSRIQAAIRSDPRFTVVSFACSPRFCMATVEGRGVPDPEAFENRLYTSPGKPKMHLSVLATGPASNSNHDRSFRIFYVWDPELVPAVMSPEAEVQRAPETQAGAKTR